MCSGRAGVGFWSLCRKQSCFPSTTSEHIFQGGRLRESCRNPAGMSLSTPPLCSTAMPTPCGGPAQRQVRGMLDKFAWLFFASHIPCSKGDRSHCD
jgi:hypothetical protein